MKDVHGNPIPTPAPANDGRAHHDQIHALGRATAIAGLSIQRGAERLLELFDAAANPTNLALMNRMRATADAETRSAIDAFMQLVQPGVRDAIDAVADSGEKIARQSVDTREVADAMQHIAHHDQLTGTVNRRGFYDRFARLQESAGHGRSFTLLMFDIDHFKKVNDNYGHEAGDAVLVDFARILKQNLQKKDSVVRWGGEEFLVVLENVTPHDAHSIAERLRMAVAARPAVPPVGTKTGMPAITTSIGVATYHPGETLEDWRDRADKALYAAKGAGRNRTLFAQGDGPPLQQRASSSVSASGSRTNGL